MLKLKKVISNDVGKRIDIDFDEGSKTVNLNLLNWDEIKFEKTFSLSFPIIFDVDKKGRIVSIEILGHPIKSIPFDVCEYIKSKKVESGQLCVTELENDQEEDYEKMGNREAFMVRFLGYKTEKFCRTHVNVFFGFDKKGILSEFIYLGRSLTKKYTG